MTKFLLAVLTMVLLSGGVRAEGVAGGEPPVRPAPEPGIVARAMRAATWVAVRLKGQPFIPATLPGCFKSSSTHILFVGSGTYTVPIGPYVPPPPVGGGPLP